MSSKASVLHQEISSLLLKGATEEVPQSDLKQGLFSRYFLEPKKDGGLRPILDLYKGKFKMLTLKTIMSQIQVGDWFVTVDLKDAYFHIQVIWWHRKFIRFAFAGKAYQYKVLPFGLALAPMTFTKCMDAALAPLRLQGIHILNYLNDWLILAHSRELVSYHRDIVLRHIRALGLRTNTKKSVFTPSRQTVFLGVHLDSVQMQAHLAPARISSFNACLACFKLGHHFSVSTYRRLLGLMATASPVLPLGLLHMRPFLWWMRLSPHSYDGRINDRLGRGHRRQTGTRCLDWRVPLLAHKLPGAQNRLPGTYSLSPPSQKVSCNSQDGNHGGGIPHKLPRGFTVAHPEQACEPSSPLVSRQVPLPESGSRSGSFEPCRRFSVEAEYQAGRMNAEPSDSSPDLGSVQRSVSGPLCISGVVPMPALVLPEFPGIFGHRCIHPSLAERETVRVSASQANFGSPVQGEGERCLSPTPSPVLAKSDVVLRAVSSSISASWEILIRQDLLPQLQGKIWHPQPEIWKLWVWPIQGH